MSIFEFELPTRVIFGAGSIDRVGEEAARLGQSALLVTGNTFARRSGLLEKICASLSDAGVGVTLLDSLEQHPTVTALDYGGQIARGADAQMVIGLGGGSAMDAAKGIAAAAAANRPLWEFVTHRDLQISQALPIISIPIIASTGSETNDRVVLFDERTATRGTLSSPHFFARLAVVDPSLAFSVPGRFTAVGAINIVSQLLESYLTSEPFAVSDRVTEGLVRVVMDSLLRALRHPDDLDARTNLAWAAAMSSSVALAGRAGTAPLRALAYPVTSTFGVEHGIALAGLWPSFMRYALSNRSRLPQIARFKRYAQLGRHLFLVHETDDEVAAEITTFRFVDWLRSVQAPVNLEFLNATAAQVPRLAEQVVRMSGDGRRLRSGLRAEDIENIYQAAMRPREAADVTDSE